MVRLKREYNDVLAKKPSQSGPRVDGETWYNLGAYRAVNQALGRVIRHRDDYGAVILIDSRWTARGSQRAVKYLPLWLRRLVGILSNFLGQHLSFPLVQALECLTRHFSTFPA